MTLRGDEAFCAARLEAWLVSAGRQSSWDAGEDPPDLAFKIGEDRWAIEVTGIHRYFQDTSRTARPAASVGGPLWKMRERLNRLAQTEVRPGMAYSLMIRGPLEAMTARVLEKLATEYIRSGSAEPKILNRRLPYALIARFQVREDLQSRLEMSLFLDGLAIGGKGDSVLADIRSNVAYAVERMLEKKLPDMEKILSYDRRALCLYAVDVLAESDVVRAVLPVDMLAHSSLDAVVLIDCENHVEAVFDPHRLLPERRAPRGEE